MKETVALAPGTRLGSLDYFRGLAIILMLVYDYVPFFTKNPPLIFVHGRTDMLLFGDLVAPFFLFIMGVSLAVAVSRRRDHGATEKQIFLRVIKRAFILIIAGLIIDDLRAPLFGGTIGFHPTWGILESLGAAYLIAYLLMLLKTKLQIPVVAAMLAAHLYLLLYSPSFLVYIRSYAHGSPASILTWSSITVFGMIAGDRLVKNTFEYEKYLYQMGGILIVVGSVVGMIYPPRKYLVTSSYALIAAGCSAIYFMLLYYLIETKRVRLIIDNMKPLVEFGGAALTAWILQYVIAAYFIWYYHYNERLPLFYGLALSAALIVVVWLVTIGAKRNHLSLRI
ncbi:MAG: heparan-alpha-glucosaminide N-acetyltransferase domain-containing protein [Actinomycetota bacterium]